MKTASHALKTNGSFTFGDDGAVVIEESLNNRTREPWLMLLARRDQIPTKTLCWGITNSGMSFARIGTQEGDLLNGFVHEDPYKAALLGNYSFVVDKDGDYASTSWYPVCREDQTLRTEFRHGSVRYLTSAMGIDMDSTSFVANESDTMVTIIKLKNTSGRTRSLSLYSVAPVNLGDARDIQFSGFNSLMLGGARIDNELDASVWRANFGTPINDDENTIKGMFGKVLVHSCSLDFKSFGTKYEDFVGHYHNTMARPQAVVENSELPNRDAEELSSALSSIRGELVLEAGEEREVVVVMAAISTEDYYTQDKAEAKRVLAVLLDPSNAQAELEAVHSGWNRQLGSLAVRVKGFDVLEPSFQWLQYQCAMVTILNRMKSRFHSGFEYGYGFRDILQDLLAELPYSSEPVKGLLRFVAPQMFSDGSVYHNFFVSAKGNKDFVACDDPLWFVYAVCEYVKESGDWDFLGEVLPYADEKEGMAPAQGSVLDHCWTGLERVWSISDGGLPQLLMADWNDDLSDYYDHKSVMAAQQLHKAYVDFARLLDEAKLWADKANLSRERAAQVVASLNQKAWLSDHGYYKRALATKDGDIDLGSPETDGLVFFEPIAWSGFSGVASAEQFDAMVSVTDRVLDDQFGVALCQSDKTLVKGGLPVDYAAWKRNAPGKKENGGEFRHLESWYMASLCQFGYGDKAWGIYLKTLPAVASGEDPYRYAAERFVFPEYVSGPASNEHGRAGHTWLTGTATTRMRCLVDWMYGVRPDYQGLVVDPCVSSQWKEFSLSRQYRGAQFHFEYQNPKGVQKGLISVEVDGTPLDLVDGRVLIPLSYCDGSEHHVRVVMG